MKMIDVVEAFGVGALGGYVVTRWMKKRAEKREPEKKVQYTKPHCISVSQDKTSPCRHACHAKKPTPDNKIVHIPRPDGHAKTVVNTRERANQIVGVMFRNLMDDERYSEYCDLKRFAQNGSPHTRMVNAVEQYLIRMCEDARKADTIVSKYELVKDDKDV